MTQLFRQASLQLAQGVPEALLLGQGGFPLLLALAAGLEVPLGHLLVALLLPLLLLAQVGHCLTL